MKLKLLPQNNQIVILVERFDDSVKIYFGDGHCEVSDEKIEDYIQRSKGKSGYKNPIEVFGQKLYPTKNKKDKDCCWINLEYLDCRDRYYLNLLKQRNIFDKAIKMFLKQKETQLRNV